MPPSISEERKRQIDQNVDSEISKLFYNGKEHAEMDTEITGNVPKWISGVMSRNGPGKFDIGTDTFGHWFDPLALMHNFTIKGPGLNWIF